MNAIRNIRSNFRHYLTTALVVGGSFISGLFLAELFVVLFDSMPDVDNLWFFNATQ